MGKITGMVWEGGVSVGVEPTATVYADTSRYGNNGSMTSGQPDWIRLPSGLWVLSFNGTDAVVDVGDIIVKASTFAAWIYPDNHTRALANLDGGTSSVEINASSNITATGWTSPTIYVNGAVAAAVTLSVWNHVVVTTGTAINISDFDIGHEATYFDGYMILVKLYMQALSAGEVRNLYQEERSFFGV